MSLPDILIYEETGEFMTQLLAVFRSRSQATDAVNFIKARGIYATLVNTPKDAHIGCGLSVAFNDADYGKVKHILSTRHYSAFYGYLLYSPYYQKNYTLPDHR
jgi:hypothetical protein